MRSQTNRGSKVFLFEVVIVADPFDDPEWLRGYVVAQNENDAKKTVEREIEPKFRKKVVAPVVSFGNFGNFGYHGAHPT